VSWDVAFEPSPEPHHYFGPWLRRFAEARTSVTIPHPRIHVAGDVVIDGRRQTVRGAPGHQAHHWGVERSPRWNWGHCAAFDDDAVLELLSAEGPGGVTVTFLNLHIERRSYRASGLYALLRNRCASGLGYWRFEGHAEGKVIVADVTVDPRLVQKFVYVSPGYRTSECWNTQVGDCLVRVYDGSQRLERVLRARGTAAAEVHDERPERIAYSPWNQRNNRNGSTALPMMAPM
jgi:hypothetical protein